MVFYNSFHKADGQHFFKNATANSSPAFPFLTLCVFIIDRDSLNETSTVDRRWTILVKGFVGIVPAFEGEGDLDQTRAIARRAHIGQAVEAPSSAARSFLTTNIPARAKTYREIAVIFFVRLGSHIAIGD